MPVRHGWIAAVFWVSLLALCAAGATGSAPSGALAAEKAAPQKSGTRTGNADYPPFFENADAGTPPGGAASPGAAPAAPANGTGNTALEGTWAASTGKQTLVFVFQGSRYLMQFNELRSSGTFQLQGQTLHLQSSEGRTQTMTWQVDGDRLILENGDTVLLRQKGQADQLGAAAPQTGPGTQQPQQYPQQQQPPQPQQQPYPQQQPQQAPQQPQPYPQQQYPQQQQPSPPQNGWPGGQNAPQGQSSALGNASRNGDLAGVWVSSMNQGQLHLICSGDVYQTYVNGRMVETGRFAFDGRQLRYQVFTGQDAGKIGVNTVEMHGFSMVMHYQTGPSRQFFRQQ